MKKLSVLLISLLFTSSLFAFQSDKENVDISEVVNVINESLKRTQAELGEDSVQSASVTFKTLYKRNYSTGISLWIISTKRSFSNEHVTTMKFNFGKPKPDKPGGEKMVDKKFAPSIDNLSKAILNAAGIYKNLKTVTGLEKQGFDISLTFTVSKDKNGTLSFEIIGIGMDGDLSEANSLTHTINLSFN